MTNFIIQELTKAQIIKLFAYYHRQRFFKYTFTEWLQNDEKLSAILDNNNTIIGFEYDGNSRYGADRITLYVEDDVLKMLESAQN